MYHTSVDNPSPYYHQISLSDKQKYFTDLFNIVKNNKITILLFYNLIPKRKFQNYSTLGDRR